MPEIKYYVVRRTQEVQVTANTPLDAAAIGEKAFETGHPVTSWGGPDDPVPGVHGYTTNRPSER
jgi:hypothetical protein